MNERNRNEGASRPGSAGAGSGAGGQGRSGDQGRAGEQARTGDQNRAGERGAGLGEGNRAASTQGAQQTGQGPGREQMSNASRGIAGAPRSTDVAESPRAAAEVDIDAIAPKPKKKQRRPKRQIRGSYL